MSERYFYFALIVLLVVFSFGCAMPESNPNKFVGEWENSLGIIYTFYTDGTYKGTLTEGTYTVEHGVLILRGHGKWEGYNVTYEYAFLDDNKMLRLTGKQNYTLTRRVEQNE